MKTRHVSPIFLPHTLGGHLRAGATEGTEARANASPSLQKLLEFT